MFQFYIVEKKEWKLLICLDYFFFLIICHLNHPLNSFSDVLYVWAFHLFYFNVSFTLTFLLHLFISFSNLLQHKKVSQLTIRIDQHTQDSFKHCCCRLVSYLSFISSTSLPRNVNLYIFPLTYFLLFGVKKKKVKFFSHEN